MVYDFKEIKLKRIKKIQTKNLLMKYHSKKYFPQLSRDYIGAIIDGEVVGFMSLGWGTRPRHTIEKLFPSLSVEDYWEIGRLVLEEELPRNSESYFISKCIDFVKEKYPERKLLFSWADGMLGKPGFIYQASNFYYGGYIWTDCYFTKKGEFVHPRQTNRIDGRPSWEEMQDLEWTHYRGKQFRYFYPLCSKGTEKRLLKESTYEWTREDYPKFEDLGWKIRMENGWVETDEPNHNPEVFEYNSQKGKEYDVWKDRSIKSLESFEQRERS